MTVNIKRRIAITGAAGNLGRRLRVYWWGRDDLDLLLLDCAPGDDPTIVNADLSQWDASWTDLLAGVETIIHLAANADADAVASALQASNIDGVRNLYRAATQHKVSRIVLASSVWAMASRLNDLLRIYAGDAEPGDNAYGASKKFAEDVAREAALAGGPKTIALRIGGCLPGANLPIHKNHWEDQCWLSNRDFCSGVDCALDAPIDGFTVVNLTSLIPNGRWDLEHTRAVIGYVPQDSFEPPPAPVAVGLLRKAARKLRRIADEYTPRTSDVDVVWPLRCQLGEAPLWDPVRACLWFLDIAGGQLHRYQPQSGETASIAMPADPAFVLHGQDGSLLLGAGSTIHRLSNEILSVETKVKLPPGARINDGCVDKEGRLWFASMDRNGIEPAGWLYRYDGIQQVRHGHRSPILNGPAFSPDGTRLYLADTIAGAIWRYGLRDGLPFNEGEVFITIDPKDGSPDGLTIDAEGALWVALWGGWAVRRYGADGRLLATIRFPCANITKIAFGGPDLKTAYATSAAIGLTAREQKAQPMAGALFKFHSSARGPLPVLTSECV